jgi:hypothetical protein
MRDPKKKCIAKKCEECHFFQSWDMTNGDGLRKLKMVCSMQVLFDEIPRMRGSIDGCQTATNETRNKVIAFGDAAIQTLEGVRPKQIEVKDESGL